MQTVILLALTIVFSFIIRPTDNRYSRLIPGAVFGMFFFAVWPLGQFYLKIHRQNDYENTLVFLAIVLMAFVLSAFLIKLRNQLAAMIISVILFIVAITGVFSYETEIKNSIAIYSGYFNKDTNHKNNATEKKDNSNRNIINAHNYTFSLTSEWIKKTDKGDMFAYYQLFDKNNLIIELRPKCFNSTLTSLPDIISRVTANSNNINAKYVRLCQRWSKNQFSCEISITKNKIKRLRWFLLDTTSDYGVELDFITKNKYLLNRKEIDKITSSVKITLKNKELYCLDLAEWL